MDTATAAQTAGVTAATIRAWCRRNVIDAVKRAGRWIVDAASLAYRITLGRKTMQITPLTRAAYEQAARYPAHDARCHGEYQMVLHQGVDSYGTPAGQLTGEALLKVQRGAALAAEGYVPPARKRGPGYAPGLAGDLFGGPSDRADECHYCGQALGASGECDECR